MSLFDRVENVLKEYNSLFGSVDQLEFSENIHDAKQDLQSLESKKSQQHPTATQQIDSNQLSSAERLAKYDAFQAKVATRRKLNEAAFANLASMELNPDSKADNRVKSRLEILAEERDFKRRRQSYKGGKSGSLKRSYNEIIRDVIETQSDMLRTMNATNMEHVEHDILVDQT